MLREKHGPLSLCPSQISHGLTCDTPGNVNSLRDVRGEFALVLN